LESITFKPWINTLGVKNSILDEDKFLELSSISFLEYGTSDFSWFIDGEVYVEHRWYVRGTHKFLNLSGDHISIWDTELDNNLTFNITFEQLWDSLSDDNRVELLFHLDLFNEPIKNK
jgi:hypothetical protein